ncbi:MAG: Gfo/Idh/MocA family oxidoreductase [Parasporobacterium sp.]|nr:Gfo/Idh/MocA family oxidoreductase [Parasporobacterium sp.]
MYNADEIKRILEEAVLPVKPQKTDYRIGCIGSGFIMKDCHLVAYRNAGFNPVAIASRTEGHAAEAAGRHGISRVYGTWQELVKDESLDIIDIAYPPDQQPEIVREAVKNGNLKGILCQKPLAMDIAGAREIAALGEKYGKKIAVNSNMRYDQSMRALKKLLDMNELGEVVLATIEMRAIPHWQTFLTEYDKLEIFGMGIHHVDIFRYLLGDPESITCVCRTDPRSKFSHVDGITQYTYQYKNGIMATSLDDVWAWPEEPCEKDIYIKWRVEGTEGMAEGTIGWPYYPEPVPSTLRFTSKNYPHMWIEPQWDKVWFPDAFEGTMAGLMTAIDTDTEPEISAADNIITIACVEACYKSIRERRTVYLEEILKG